MINKTNVKGMGWIWSYISSIKKYNLCGLFTDDFFEDDSMCDYFNLYSGGE